jgi:3-oxoacyl-[acyl-carrier protein] reductase
MAYHARVLDGVAVLVTPAASTLGDGLAGALAELGASVTTGGAAAAPAPAISALVHVCVVAPSPAPRTLVDTTPEQWDDACEAPLRDAIVAFQAAHARFVPEGRGRIVVVAPTSGITGAGGFVPFSTAVEGVRALAKSAARQWGPHGITVNTVLVPPDLVAPELATATMFNSPPVVGHLPDVRDDVAAAVALFLAPTVGGITGSTVIVDGGSVMAP